MRLGVRAGALAPGPVVDELALSFERRLHQLVPGRHIDEANGLLEIDTQLEGTGRYHRPDMRALGMQLLETGDGSIGTIGCRVEMDHRIVKPRPLVTGEEGPDPL